MSKEREPPTIQIEINKQWFKKICNVQPRWSVEDSIMYAERLTSGGKTQILIMLGEECLRQMKEQG